MIIFYNKKTGKIVGTIDGRVHNKTHLKMWVGDKKENDRLIIDWKQTGKEIERKIIVDKKLKILKLKEYEPQTSQREIFIEIDKNPRKLKEYKVDLKTKQLIAFG